MSRIELAPKLRDDFDRIFEDPAQYDLDNVPARIREIMRAFDVLETNPLIGRPAQEGNRELIIGRSSHGHAALYRYRYVPEIDTVFILAVRSQREAGYKRG